MRRFIETWRLAWVVTRLDTVGNVSAVGYPRPESERSSPRANVMEPAMIGGYGTGGLRLHELGIGRRRR